MTRLLDLGIDRINKILDDMVRLAEKSFIDAIDSYGKGISLSKNSFRISEKLRILQDEISEISIELIARYQPVATDLRFIKSSLEISYNISRFGRYSFDIVDLIQESGPLEDCDKSRVLEISKTVREMIMICSHAIDTWDIGKVKELYQLENNIDREYKKYLRDIIQSSEFSLNETEKRQSFNCYLTSLLILRYLERICDHACSIGDSINYIKYGKSSPRL
jgi:phosphate transport system protein